MKIALRIISLLVSLLIVVYAFLPPSLTSGKRSDDAEDTEETVATKDSTSSEELSEPSQAVYNILGGGQLETGQRAKDQLNQVHKQRQERMGELGGFGPQGE